MAKDSDILAEAKEAFDQAADAEGDNRKEALDDLKFARLSQQWPEQIIHQRRQEGRPCLTINRMPAFIRQVVNDARQNKPSIKVHPVDSGADKETADILNGLIRNIEYTSNADVAYDTAAECAVGMGCGYFRIGVDFAHDDTFDLDITIDRISNPFVVYGDPMSTAADSSDWKTAFVIEMMKKDEFEATYKGAEAVDWDGAYFDVQAPWLEDDSVMVAEWWRVEETERSILLLSDGRVVDEEWWEAPADDLPEGVIATRAEIGSVLHGITPKRQRLAKRNEVTQYCLTGAEVLKTEPWKGKYIPIVPVYGDEVDVEGKRHFRSLIRDAKDAQRMFNYWRTTTTEMVALAPKAPWIGKKGFAKTDIKKWTTANSQTHAYLEYDGEVPPMRQGFDGPPAAALQEALNSADDMKAIMGLYDASLGQKSNETSGRAILARQREGDTSTFHFVDNLSRAIRHAGRILIDLIPHVYSTERIVRTIGEDGTQDAVPVNQPTPVLDEDTGEPQVDEMGQAITRIYDLTAGKYDLTVTSGPSYTTRREEAAVQMMEMLRSFPDAAPIVGDLIAKNLDWPGADEFAKRFQAMLPAQVGGGLPPEVQQAIEEGQALIAKLQEENAKLKGSQAVAWRNTDIAAHKADTERLKAIAPAMTPEQITALVYETVMNVLNSPDVSSGDGGPPMPSPATSPMGGSSPMPGGPPMMPPDGPQMQPGPMMPPPQGPPMQGGPPGPPQMPQMPPQAAPPGGF